MKVNSTRVNTMAMARIGGLMVNFTKVPSIKDIAVALVFGNKVKVAFMLVNSKNRKETVLELLLNPSRD